MSVPPLKQLPRTLKEAERLIKNRERAGAMISHQLGTLYAHVLREELFREAGFATFWEWAEKRMGRTRKDAQRLISMVAAFPAEKEVSMIGVRNARVIASVRDPRSRKRLAEAAKKGASSKVIAKKVRRLRNRDRELQSAKRPGQALKYIEVDKLIAFRRNLELGRPVKIVEGLTVEVVRAGAGRYRVVFKRSD